MPADLPQIELWSHFQTEQTGAFDLAKKRLDSLIRRAEKLTKRRTLLSIGCGNGHLERTAQARHWQVVSVDPDPKSVDRVKSMGVDARCGTIESLPVPSDSVDVVICTELFEHLTPATLNAGLEEIKRVLVPEGILMGTVPYRENLADNQVFCPHCNRAFHRWGHQQSFDEAAMRSVLSQTLTVRKVKPVYFVPWASVGWKGRLLWSARFAFSLAGVYGSGANLLFVATKVNCIRTT